MHHRSHPATHPCCPRLPAHSPRPAALAWTHTPPAAGGLLAQLPFMRRTVCVMRTKSIRQVQPQETTSPTGRKVPPPPNHIRTHARRLLPHKEPPHGDDHHQTANQAAGTKVASRAKSHPETPHHQPAPQTRSHSHSLVRARCRHKPRAPAAAHNDAGIHGWTHARQDTRMLAGTPRPGPMRRSLQRALLGRGQASVTTSSPPRRTCRLPLARTTDPNAPWPNRPQPYR